MGMRTKFWRRGAPGFRGVSRFDTPHHVARSLWDGAAPRTCCTHLNPHICCSNTAITAFLPYCQWGARHGAEIAPGGPARYGFRLESRAGREFGSTGLVRPRRRPVQLRDTGRRNREVSRERAIPPVGCASHGRCSAQEDRETGGGVEAPREWDGGAHQLRSVGA